MPRDLNQTRVENVGLSCWIQQRGEGDPIQALKVPRLKCKLCVQVIFDKAYAYIKE